jgi:hypothetical protein
MVCDILQHHPPLEDLDRDFAGTPCNGQCTALKMDGIDRAVIIREPFRLIIRIGAEIPAKLGGSAAVQSVLSKPTS